MPINILQWRFSVTQGLRSVNAVLLVEDRMDMVRCYVHGVVQSATVRQNTRLKFVDLVDEGSTC